jgi:signal transduction histidine kinase
VSSGAIPTLSAATLVVLTLVGVTWLVSAAALLVVRRAVVAALLLAAAGAATVAGCVLAGTGHDRAAWYLLVAAGGLFLPLALTTYPLPRLRHPIDLAALVVVTASGLVCTALADRELVVGSLGIVIGVVLFGHTWFRIETSRDRERRALQWIALSVGSVALVAALVTFASEGAAPAVVALGLFGLLGPVLYVGVALQDIVDVRGLVVSAVVLAGVGIAYLAMFVTVASLVEVASGTAPTVGALGLLAAVLAATFHPLRVRLRGVVDELLFGRRPDPLDAASRVAGRIGEDPEDALRAIREALVLPYAALRAGGVAVQSSGSATTSTRSFPLEGAPGDTGAELVVGLRPGDLGLSRDDEHALALVAPLLAQTLRAQALAAELQESRGATVAALEEERRRLRRDLHDGLGPRLSGIAFTSDAARNLVHADPDGAEALLAELRADTVAAIEEIRELVYAMRPPALDELGLVPALRQQADGLRSRDGSPLDVTMTAPDELPDLPAAVEVAAYRIVIEALTNVARHSPSRSAAVRLDTPSGRLSVVVTDAGAPGGGEPWPAGVGLSSMRERAAQVGGSLTAGPTARGGRVEALLPLR